MRPFNGVPPSERSGSARSGNRASIWVVDDSPLQGEVARSALAPNFDAVLFESGASALECLGSGAAPPDVLVLDWHMPDVSGAEVCRFIRTTFNSAQLPIVILTATETSDDLLDALAAGANDFIQKPASGLELNARVGGLAQLTKLHALLSEAERKLRLEAVFRERFIGMLAHDLRQPLSTVVMGCQLLSQLKLPDDAVAIIERHIRATERMHRMVTDLLDSTRHRPESGMPIHKRRMDFAELAQTSLVELRSAHPDRELALSVDGACTGYWDSDRLAQILSNLVGNALTHGQPCCRIDVRLTGKPDHVELRVANPGEPIPNEVFDTIEQPFRRSRATRNSGEGLGLGLHIVHQIVQAHRGTLVPQSHAGETRVVVSLPREDRENEQGRAAGRSAER